MIPRIRSGLMALVCSSVLVLAICCDSLPGQEEPPPQLQWLAGHTGSIYATGSSRDGKTLFSAGADGTIRLWDRETGELIRTIQAGQEPVLELALSPDGYQLAAGSRDTLVRLYDLSGRYPLKEMAGINGVPTAIAAFGDGLRIVTADESRLVRIISTANGQPAGDYGGMTAPAAALATIPFPEMIVAAGRDGTVRGWAYGNGTPQWLLTTTPQRAIAVQPVKGEVDENGKPVPPASRLLAGAGEDGLLRLFTWPPPAPQALPNHSNDVTSVELSADGSLIVSGALDQQVRLHDAATNKQKFSLAGLAAPVYSTAFSPDGSMVAASGSLGTVQFWETEKGEARSRLTGHTGIVYDVAFHPTQPQVATAGADGSVRLWSLPAVLTPWAGHGGAVHAVNVGTGGRVVATASADKTIRLWDPVEQKQTSVIASLQQPATALSLSADGKQVAFGDATGQLSVASVADGKVLQAVQAHAGQVTGIRWLPEAAGLVTCGAEGSLKFWNLPLSAAGSLVDQPQPTRSVAAAPDGKTSYVGAADGAVRAFDTTTGKLVHTFAPAAPPSPVGGLAVSPDGKLLAAADDLGRLRFWTIADQTELTTVSGHTGAIHDVQFSADGTRLATAGADNSVRVWQSPAASTEVATHAKPVTALAISPASSRLISTGADGSVTIHDTSAPAGKPLAQIAADGTAATCTTISADGSVGAVGRADGSIQLFEAATGKSLGDIGLHPGGVSGLAFDATAQKLASVGADGALRLWKLPVAPGETLASLPSPVTALVASADGKRRVLLSGKTIQTLENGAMRTVGAELAAPGTALAISADGKLAFAGTADGSLVVRDIVSGDDRLQVNTGQGAIGDVAIDATAARAVTAGSDGTVRLWDVPAAPVPALAAHAKPVTALVKSPNGQLLATASADGTIRLRNAADGKDVRTLTGHAGEVTAIAWRADSNVLVSAGADGSVRLWTTSDGKNVTTLEKAADGGLTAVAVLPDSSKVIIGTATGKVIVRSTTAPDEEPLEVAAHQKPVTLLHLLPDGKTLLSASADGTFRSWSTADGKPGYSVNAGAAVTGLSLSVDGKLAAITTAGKTCRLYQVADGKPAGEAMTLPAPGPATSISADGKRLAILCDGGQLEVREAATGRILSTRPGAKDLAGDVVFGVDDRTLYVAGTANTVQPVRVALSQLIEASEMPLHAVVFNPAGSQIAAGGDEKTIKLWNVSNGAAAWTATGHTDAVHSLAFNLDGSQLYSGSKDKTARIWNAGNGQPVGVLQHESAVQSVAVLTPQNRLVTSTSEFGCSVWDATANLRLQRFISHKGGVNGAILSADAAAVLTAGDDGQIRQEPIAATVVVAAHEGGAAATVFSLDGNQVFTTGADMLVKHFDLTGKLVRPMSGFQAPATTLSLRPDGTQLLAGCENGRVCQWNVNNGQLVRSLEAGAKVTGTAWTADGSRMLAATADGNLRAWASADGLLQEMFPLEKETTSLVATSAAAVVTGNADGKVRLRPLLLERLIPGHTGAVQRVAFHPDGKSVISASADKTVRQWNLADGAALGTFGGHTDAVVGLAVSADGMQVYSAGRDRTLRGWNAANRQTLFTITHAVPFRDLSLDPESGRVVTTGDDRVVRVWDPVVQRELESFAGHADQIARVALLPGGTAALSAGNDRKSGHWPVSTRQVVAADSMRVHAMELLPDGSGVLTAGDDRLVRLWSPAGEEIRTFSGAAAPLRDVAVSGDGKLIAAGGDPLSAQKNALLWNLVDGKLIANIATPAAVTGVSLSGTQTLAVTGADQQVRLYDTSDGSLLEQIAFPAVLTSVGVLSDAGEFVAGAANNQVFRFRRSMLKKWEAHPGGATRLVFTPDGTRIVTAGADKTLTLWNPADSTVAGRLTGHTAAVTDLAITDDGRYLFSTAGDTMVRQYELAKVPAGGNLAPMQTFEHTAAVRSVTATADGSRLYVGGTDNQIHIWHPPTGKLLERLTGHTSHITTLDASADGRVLISGSLDDTTRSWQPSVVAVVPAHGETMNDVAFSADGASVFSAGADNVVRRFSVPDLQPGAELAGAEGTLTTLDISRDGKIVAAAGSDGKLRLWNSAAGQLLAETTFPETTATDVVLGDDGTRISVLTAAGVMRVLSLQPAEGETLELVPVQESVPHPEGATALARGDDERFVYSLGSDRKVRSWLSSQFGPRAVLTGHRQPVFQLAWRPDGTQLASAGGGDTIRLWDVESGEEAFTCAGHAGGVTGLSFAANSRELASAGRDGTIRLWNCVPPPEPPAKAADGAAEKDGDEEQAPPPKLGDELARFETDGEARLTAVLYARGRNEVYAGLSDGRFLIFNRADGTQAEPRIAHNAAIYHMTYNPAGSRITTLDVSGQLVIWNASNQGMIYHQALPLTTGWTAEYAADGIELLIGGNDERVLRLTVPPPVR